jgi:hypothetical protein
MDLLRYDGKPFRSTKPVENFDGHEWDTPDENKGLGRRLKMPRLSASGVDLRDKLPPVADQGDCGSCVGWALAACAQARTGRGPYSARWIYELRAAMGDMDPGMGPDAGMTIGQLYGFAEERFRPYQDTDTWCWTDMDLRAPFSDNKCGGQFSLEEIYQNASQALIESWGPLSSRSEVRDELRDGPVLLALNSWHEKSSRRMIEKFWRRPEGRERSEFVTGGHAVAVVGYDDGENAFLVRNSWGMAWGDEGHFHLPYSDWEHLNEASPGRHNHFAMFGLDMVK